MGFFKNLLGLHKKEDFIHRPEGRFLNVQIDLINRCNIKCIMCPVDWMRSKEPEVIRMKPELLERIAEEVFPRAHYLSYAFDSEPLMVKELLDFIPLSKERGVPHVEIITNGMLLDEAKIDRLIDSGLDAVVFSVDGATKETYEKIRKGGDFDKLLSNVRLLRKMRDARGSVTPIIKFNFTMMRSNVEEVPDFVLLARDLGGTNVDLRHVVLFKRLNMSREALFHHKELTNRILDRAREQAREAGLTLVSCPNNFDLSGRAVERGPLRQKDYQNRCPFPWQHLIITPEGDAWPCCFWFARESLGNFSEQSFDEIWNGDKYLELRRELTLGLPSRRCCKECFVFRFVDEPEFFNEHELK